MSVLGSTGVVARCVGLAPSTTRSTAGYAALGPRSPSRRFAGEVTTRQLGPADIANVCVPQ
jgi:hypothetical protein